MKGVSVLVAAVLVIAISIAAITIALNVGNPAIQRSKEILVLNEGKENLKIIDNAIDQVLQEGDGSSRKISLQVTGGMYKITENYIEFTMDTEQQIMHPDASGSSDGIYFDVGVRKITASINYNFNFVGEKLIEKGFHQLVVSNQGGDIAVS